MYERFVKKISSFNFSWTVNLFSFMPFLAIIFCVQTTLSPMEKSWFSSFSRSFMTFVSGFFACSFAIKYVRGAKMKIIFVFIVIYSLTDKLVINLLVGFWTKIAHLKFRIVSLCSKSTRSVLIYTRPINCYTDLQYIFCSIYFFVFLEQAPFKIFLTLFIGIEAGKILKMLVWDNINLQLLFSGKTLWKM